jgi:hypothetical protein
MLQNSGRRNRFLVSGILVGLIGGGVAAMLIPTRGVVERKALRYKPRQKLETSGVESYKPYVQPWKPDASLEEIGKTYEQGLLRCLEDVNARLAAEGSDDFPRLLFTKASLYQTQGNPRRAYEILEELRSRLEGNNALAEEHLYTTIYYQGVTGLRLGETENCVLCRGVSACILPILPEAVHTNPEGSRLAIKHFSEYLQQFPDDLRVKWLLNLAHMTLGEHPDNVDPRYLLSLDAYLKNEINIGQFRDVGHLVGLNRLNQSGGAIMEDFDNDSLLDIVVTSIDPSAPMAFYRNKGDGTFEDRTKAAGLDKQLGGLYCVQVDYNNDGHMDIFIPRGAWQDNRLAMRPSLLRNNGDGTFTDVTREAGLLRAVNSISATWADFDNDGFVDLFVCCEKQLNLLYRNKGDGTFQEIAFYAGVQGTNKSCKGAAWIDFDNDGYPDLFLNYLGGTAQLFHNNRDGTFTDVTKEMGIDGPLNGFSCWAFDFDNDGWLDIFATCYAYTLEEIIKGLLDQPSPYPTSKLYRNLKGKGFQDVTKQMGLDKVYATMGSNFGDFTNDGYLDIYLGTGEPDLAALVPNRMFKNVAGKRFAEITASSRTGHLQKGHGVACGDWARRGYVDIFEQMGGPTNGDRYHNVLFRNPGQGNNWLNVKLVGKKTNRAAIGARIKVVTAGEKPLTVHRHVSSGSSFGANPLEQHIGLGKADRVAVLEVYWPTSGTTQVFRDMTVNQGVVITEFAEEYQKRTWKPIALPKSGLE